MNDQWGGQASLVHTIASVVYQLQEHWAGQEVARLKGELAHMSPVEQPGQYHYRFKNLVAMEAYRRALERAVIASRLRLSLNVIHEYVAAARELVAAHE